ncbi:hypothetical protein JOD55_000158 [Arcanobacterium pluranimalium]|uniref:peptidase inhibitor family I36 protein n=1 Tax=Arcanobacterium pluranimalium TaxID=108028 RepID=UPI00195627D7|nr:hypothetical protein [Arcanobacterium pluranimalium]
MNKKTRSLKASIAALALAATSLVVAAPIANAGTGACPLGASCMWSESNYNGRYGYNTDHSSPVIAYMNNQASSIAANGRSCHFTQFFDWRDGNDGSYILLRSQYLEGFNFRDPLLSNGAGEGPFRDQNWDNRISRVTYADCR